MAARYLARSPAMYNAPLVLLVLTLGLSAFTASLAKTLDTQLDKQMRYQVGADINLYEFGTTFNEGASEPVYTFVICLPEAPTSEWTALVTRDTKFPLTTIP